jgi:hypothetical protein
LVDMDEHAVSTVLGDECRVHVHRSAPVFRRVTSILTVLAWRGDGMIYNFADWLPPAAFRLCRIGIDT